MPTSVRERILQAVEAAAQAITTANGFDNSVRRTFRAGESTLQVPEWPAVLVIDGGDAKTPQRLNAGYGNILRVELKTLLNQPDATQRPIDVSSIQADVVRKMEEDVTWGGLAEQTRISVETSALHDVASPEGITLVTLLIKYRTVQNNPALVLPVL